MVNTALLLFFSSFSSICLETLDGQNSRLLVNLSSVRATSVDCSILLYCFSFSSFSSICLETLDRQNSKLLVNLPSVWLSVTFIIYFLFIFCWLIIDDSSINYWWLDWSIDWFYLFKYDKKKLPLVHNSWDADELCNIQCWADFMQMLIELFWTLGFVIYASKVLDCVLVEYRMYQIGNGLRNRFVQCSCFTESSTPLFLQKCISTVQSHRCVNFLLGS